MSTNRVGWRHQLAELGFYGILLGMLLLLGGFSWLTRNPEAAVVERAEQWPVVGPLAKAFRAKYVPPERRGEGATEGAVVVDPREREDFLPPAQRGRLIWLLRGATLLERPDLGSTVLHRVDRAAANAYQLDRRETWYHVYLEGREGWVHLPDYDPDRDPPYGSKPDPLGPLPPRPPDEEALASARELLGTRERVVTLGPYTAYTDVDPGPLLDRLDRLAAQVEAVYRSRVGRQPLGEPKTAIVIYRGEVAYRVLQQRSAEMAGLVSSGHHGQGLVVLYVGSRDDREIGATLVHELVHSLNRRAIGPALPPWLDEGLADDLAASRVDSAGGLVADELGGAMSTVDSQVLIDGGLGSLWQLVQSDADGTLPRIPQLLRLDWDAFVRTADIAMHYDTSGFFVRFLFEGENGRWQEPFRNYLDAISQGQPATPEELERWLGQQIPQLESSFRQWLTYRAMLAELPLGAPSVEPVASTDSEE